LNANGLTVQALLLVAILVGLTVGARWMPPHLEDRLRPLRILLTAIVVILGVMLALTLATQPHH
jgi:hypothetical protein